MEAKQCIEHKWNNCGQIIEGDKYCIFHKPNKNKEEAKKFYEAIKALAFEEEVPEEEKLEKNVGLNFEHRLVYNENQKRYIFNDELDFSAYVFPSIPSNLELNKERLVLEGAELFTFISAIFKKRVSFRSAIFEENIFFNRVEFGGAVEFDDAICKADFVDSKFKGWTSFFNTVFETSVHFNNSVFEGNIDFHQAIFKNGAYFQGAIFEKVAYFSSCDFQDKVLFGDSVFKGLAVFFDLNFHKKVDFSSVNFLNTVGFNGSVFKGILNFDKTTFERDCRLEKAFFEDKLYFTNVAIKHGIVMEEDPWNKEKDRYKLPQAEKEGCRVQKISYEEEGKKDEADIMFVREMRARREERTYGKPFRESWLEYPKKYLETILVDWTCEYGTNWRRILGVSALVIVMFSFIYWLINEYEVLRPIGTVNTVEDKLVENYWLLLFYSVVNFTTLGSDILYSTGVTKALTAIQSVIGVLLAALIVAVFARKWMR